MKKIILFCVLIITFANVEAQVNITASMGVNYFSMPSLKDYVNINYAGGTNLISSFSSSVSFLGEIDAPYSDNFEYGFEYAYELYSYNTPSLSGGQYSITLNQHKLSLLGYYVIKGKGYEFKFGGGGGLRFLSVDEEIYNSQNYKSTGYGFLLRACGLTSLGGDLYANIGVEMRYDLPGEPSNGQNKIFDGILNKNVNFNSFSVGLKIGITYFL